MYWYPWWSYGLPSCGSNFNCMLLAQSRALARTYRDYLQLLCAVHGGQHCADADAWATLATNYNTQMTSLGCAC